MALFYWTQLEPFPAQILLNLEWGNFPFFVCFCRNAGILLLKWFWRHFWIGMATCLKNVRQGSVIIGMVISSSIEDWWVNKIFLTLSSLSLIFLTLLLSGWSHSPPLLRFLCIMFSRSLSCCCCVFPLFVLCSLYPVINCCCCSSRILVAVLGQQSTGTWAARAACQRV
jgi:hypothetical protein